MAAVASAKSKKPDEKRETVGKVGGVSAIARKANVAPARRSSAADEIDQEEVDQLRGSPAA